MNTVWLNLGSIIFGLIALTLPVISMARHDKDNGSSKWAVFSIASLSACAISLCMQIFEFNHRVKIEDWSALLDTSSAVSSVALILLVITIILNALTVAVYYDDAKK